MSDKKTKRKRNLKKGDVVLASSPAGDIIPNTHLRLIEKVEVKPSKGRRMDWPGYTGWHAELVYQDEADALRKEFGIPFSGPGDKTFVFESHIIKRVIKLRPEKPKASEKTPGKNKRKGRRRIVRTRSSDG